MARVVFTASADADAAGIFAELKIKAGEPTVLKYRALFRKLYANLADYPNSGPPRSAFGPDIHIGIVFPYIVVYHHDEGRGVVTVLRVVHGRRKISGRLLR